MNPAATRVRAAMRARIDGERQLRSIEDIVSRLTNGMEPHTDPATLEVTWVPLDATRVASLKAALDAHFKLLGKVLPDLKAVEITGEDGQPLPTGGGDKLVLATKLLALMRSEKPDDLPAFLQ